MKVALCCPSFSHINDFLTTEKTKHLPVKFIDREVCETMTDGTVQIIPTFSLVSHNGSLIHFMTYERPENISEKRLASKKSITIGGHIDSENDLPLSIQLKYFYEDKQYTKEELNDAGPFMLNKEDFQEMIHLALRREIREELGERFLEHLDSIFTNNKLAKTQYDYVYLTNSDVNKVHYGVNLTFYVEEQDFDKLLDLVCNQEEEVRVVRKTSIDASDLYTIIEEYKIDDPIALVKETIEEHYGSLNYEDWSIYLIGKHVCT